MRGRTGLARRHAARGVVFDFLSQVADELPGALLVPITATEETHNAHCQFPPRSCAARRPRDSQRRTCRGMTRLLRRGPQDPIDRADDLVPAGRLGLEL